MKDLLKAVIALLFYAGLAPLLGMVLASRRTWQRAVFALMVFIPSWHPGKFTLMMGSVETYRGHAKGFEISLLEVLALALIIAVLTGKPRALAKPDLRHRGLPPGLFLYGLWCFAAMLSIVHAVEPSYALMALVRWSKGTLILAAAILYLRDEDDLRWAGRGLAVGLVVQALVCLKLRYFDGRFQVKGWFEHQNSMAMWAYMSALPLMALALHRRLPRWDTLLFIAGIGGGGLCILLSVSRAALAVYAAGCLAILLLAWWRQPGIRPALATVGGALGAVMVMLFAMDSINARMREVEASKEETELDLRDILNLQSAAMFHDHPWVGLGWNHFGVANSRPRGDRYSQILEDWDESRGFTIYEENYLANPLTESLYWLWLAETGLAGFVAFLCFELATLGWALRVWWKEKESLFGSAAGGLGVMLTLCYAHGMVERILTQPKNLSMWLLLAGMLGGMEWRRRSDARQPKNVRR